jgi:hypothetical protein
MTETIAPAESQAAESPRIPRPHTDAAALRAIEEATAHVRERALRIRENPEEHKPKLVLSQHVRETRQDTVAAAAHHLELAAAVHHDLAAGQRQPGSGRE